MVPGESFLDPSPAIAEVTVQGLNANGVVVSTATGEIATKLFFEYENEVSGEVTTGLKAFNVTLPDDGSVQKIRIIENGISIATADVYPKPALTLNVVMNNLSKSHFKGSTLASGIALSLVKVTYASYLNLKLKKKYKEAQLALVALAAEIKISLKDTINLNNGQTTTKEQIIALIKAEATSIPKK